MLFGKDNMKRVKFEVVTAGANVRIAPGKDPDHVYYPIIKTIARGDVVNVVGTATTANDSKWHAIELGDGVGWVWAELLTQVVENSDGDPKRRFHYKSWPTEHKAITQPQGANKEFYSKYGLKDGHEGCDFRTGAVGTDIYAVYGGVVAFVRDGRAARHQTSGVYTNGSLLKEEIKAFSKAIGLPIKRISGGNIDDHVIMLYGTNDDHAKLNCKHITYINTDVISIDDVKKKVDAAIKPHNYGIAVYIDHIEGYQTVYAHLDSRLVEAGDTVKAGQLIGLAGETGNCYGTHLHITLYKKHPYTGKRQFADQMPFVYEALRRNND